MVFEDIIGHDVIKRQLNNSIISGKLSHAYLFVGEDGIGKSCLANTFAINILGKSEKKQYVDIIHWRIEKGKKSIGIKEVINIIGEINKKPYEGDKKVIVIHNVEDMTIEAQNAFLKTIEEPPVGVHIILLCENLEEILDTIKSRCQIYKLRKLSKEQITTYIKNKYPNLSSNELNNAISFSDGIPGRAEMFIEDKSLKVMRDTIIEIFQNLKKKSTSEILEYKNFFIKYNDQWEEVLTCMASYIRDIVVYKETGNEILIINVDKISNIKDFSEIYSFNQLNKIMDILNDTKEILQSNVNASLTFSTMLLKIQEV